MSHRFQRQKIRSTQGGLNASFFIETEGERMRFVLSHGYCRTKGDGMQIFYCVRILSYTQRLKTKIKVLSGSLWLSLFDRVFISFSRSLSLTAALSHISPTSLQSVRPLSTCRLSQGESISKWHLTYIKTHTVS